MSRTDRGSRTIEAPTATVYAALVQPRALLAWLPPDGMTGRFEHFDARPGGGLGCDDRQRGSVLGLEHAIDRIGNGSVWCRCCHRRTNASQRRRG